MVDGYNGVSSVQLINPQWVFTDARPHYAIVVHKTAGFTKAQECVDYFLNGSEGRRVSSHYVVGLDGEIIQVVDEKDGSGANCCLETGYDASLFSPAMGNLNLYTITIEHIDPTSDNSTSVPDSQKQASFALIADICKRKNIDNWHIAGHGDIAPISRARCPGTYPWSELFDYLNNEGTNPLNGQAPKGWRDDPTNEILYAPDGTKVVRGFRKEVLNSNWNSADTPVTEETGANPIEYGFNQTPSGGTRQIFRYTMLGWTSARGVYRISMGNEYVLALQTLNRHSLKPGDK